MSTGYIGDDVFTLLVIDSLFVGETDNIGNPRWSVIFAKSRGYRLPLL
jgi:hypothetical protein